jgi:hypothetical protein
MKSGKWIAVTLAAAALLPLVIEASEGGRNYQLHNRLRFEYDDNIRDEDSGKTSSFKIIEEVEILYNINLENTFLSLRYKPSFVWWENREDDETDLHHDLDFIFNHAFNPRLSLSVKDTLRFAELPEIAESGVITRRNSDYLFNSLNGILGYQVTPDGRLELGSRYNLLRYDDDVIAEAEDYNLYVAGLTYRYNLVPETAVTVDSRMETIDYEGPIDRGSDNFQVGAGVEHMFSPNFLGNTRLGYQQKDYNDDELDSESEPFIDASLTFVPSPATRVTAGVGYSMFEADVFPYANQNRARMYVGAAHDITQRISLNVVGSYINSDYEAVDAVDVEGVEARDGTEDIMQFSTRATYRINRSNWVEAGWQFVTVDSDLRQNYDRNRFSVGWKTQL